MSKSKKNFYKAFSRQRLLLVQKNRPRISSRHSMPFSLDACIITSCYKEESIAELVGEVTYNCRIKNPDLNFSTIAVGKWGNVDECHEFEKKSGELSYRPLFSVEVFCFDAFLDFLTINPKDSEVTDGIN